MYISKIIIEGFRNFPKNTIEFNEGVNVIIGHNNAGKTSLLRAIGLIIDQNANRRLEIDDFSKSATLAELLASPPAISISMFINQSDGEDLTGDDLVTVADWLVQLQEPYQARLTYSFFLPSEHHAEYGMALLACADKSQAWQTIKHQFLRFYVSKIYGGDPSLALSADSLNLQKFDFQFLNAIRDVERDMFTGKNTMLRDVLDFFIDYEIKSADEAVKNSAAKQTEIKLLKTDFSIKSNALINELQARMKAGKEHILSYATQTGATFNNAEPDFDGSISEVELYSALKLIIGYTALDIKIPATHNGLGYNNLIFMSLLLAKMQVNADGNYLGSNAKIFPVLAIEEPEAHLHPSMQYKFLKFLKDNKNQRKVRQIFVTTHSTQITSAVSLDEIICLHNEQGVISVGYPGKSFPNTERGKTAKAYVQRFLDATRSDMLFAQRIIMVEGLAEELLLPTLARCHGKNLEDHHIAIIPVGGRYFDYFLYMFDSTQPHTIHKMVACLKDRDPERKKITGRSFIACYPYDHGHDPSNYTYQDNITGKKTTYASHANIRFFGQDHDKGKTFEYELCLENMDNDILLTEFIQNREELQELLNLYQTGRSVDDMIAEMRTSSPNTEIGISIKALTSAGWNDSDKKKAIVASRYLNSVGKGENALELANVLELNRTLPTAVPTGTTGGTPISLQKTFNVPQYIKDSLDWICR
ncbi:ATP-dependent nuclease [Algoriphagus winogradskyi]|uniref:Predicted ATP-dependent endonuclease of the OLD family, contains P-loop ATPase and TOPRIM domains n=1 Tax=Algoriphagus winogradskyi TaxID=237017 RepID=A0ABY1NSQ2_9BACT|nr:AAA family ATPase [Algoriphagus winogradskyi]SMP16950.1 Predicted ATP-dependent endonuclease of the OLD family, contains P-loop ATPase and TOPRIM domains [Algoriphagus winogradskyi]